MRSVGIWVLLIAVFCVVYVQVNQPEKEYLNAEKFVERVETGVFDELWFDGDETAATSDSEHVVTRDVLDEDQWQAVTATGIEYRDGKPGVWQSLLFYVVLILVAVVAVVFFLRRMQGGGGGGLGNVFELRRTRAKLLDDGARATFADVGGCVEAKLMLGDVVDFLRHPNRWLDAGARLPRGILLEGPPGCGKTLLARAVAGETDAKFYTVSASEFVEMFVGVGAARVRDTFETAAKNAPAVVFIDELDAVGRRRGSGTGSANDEREHTLNQLLVSLDGFRPNDRVVVIAATNRVDVLDSALLRPGRFDRRVKIDLLTRADREAVLKIHAKEKPLSDEVSLAALADETDGFSGAQLESLLNEAALLAVRRTRLQDDGEKPRITWQDVRAALDPSDSRDRVFDQLDAILVESTTQLAEPTGRAVVRCEYEDGSVVEGEVVWMDASFVKLRRSDGSGLVIAKHQLRRIEPLAGTERATDVRPDAFVGRHPDAL